MIFNTTTRSKVACMLLIAIWVYAAWPTLFGMFKTYYNSGFDYQGILALPLFLLLFQQRRGLLKRAKLSPSPWALFILLSAALLWLFATITTLNLLAQVALISMLSAIILTMCGGRVVAILAYPLLALFLLIPFGKPLYYLLQQTFTNLMLHCLALSKIAIYWEDSTILIGKQEYSLDQLCTALRYSSLYLTLGFCVASYVCRNILLRFIITINFVVMPFLLLFICSFAILIISFWQNIANFAPTTISLFSWVSTILGVSLAMYIAILLRSKPNNLSKNDGIDWRNEFATHASRWLPITTFAAAVIFALPFGATYLKHKQHYANNWHDDQNVISSKEVTLIIDDKYDANKIVHSDPNKWHQIKHNKIKIAINGTVIPLTETISVNKYQGKITWNMHYTNGHLTNNKTYTKVLENMYSLTKPGAKSAEITLAADLDVNLQKSRNTLKNALSELQKTATTTWLR